MPTIRRVRGITFVAFAAALACGAAARGQTPLGPTFTYQGRLELNGAPVANASDLQFSLWTAATGGTQIGSIVSMTLTPSAGVFTADLNFGVASLNGDERWLQIAVRNPAGGGTYTTLTPRQRLNGAPYAVQTRGIYVDASERVGIGTTMPQNPLHVFGNGDALALEGTDHTYIEFFPDGMAAGRKAYFGFGSGANDNIILQNETAAGNIIIRGNGKLGINLMGAAIPSATLEVGGNAKATKLELSAGGIRRGGTEPAATDLGLYSLTSATPLRLVSNNSPIHFFTNSTVGTSTSPAADTAALTVAANGNVGVGAHSPAAKLDVRGNGASVAVTNTAGSPRAIVGHNGGVDAGYMQIRSTTNQTIAGLGGSTTGNVFVANAAGQVRAQMAVDANGKGIATSDIVVITGGSDIAEPYDIAPAGDVAALPGMVVSIDPQRLGGMRVCQTAFDRKVAGIISGANGVQPGLIMRQTGSIADGDMPVAASGRVWCLVDADANGAIEPGDLLTTSSTPGHAMRVTDPTLALGAVIGKAMSPLSAGRGYVLVLVSLQ